MTDLADIDAKLAVAEAKADRIALLWRAREADVATLDEALSEIARLRKARTRAIIGEPVEAEPIRRNSVSNDEAEAGRGNSLAHDEPGGDRSSASGLDLTAIEQRLAAIESRPEMRYCGVYQPAQHYEQASLVTCSGSMWYANERTDRRPGTAESGWTMCAKSGSFGKERRK